MVTRLLVILIVISVLTILVVTQPANCIVTEEWALRSFSPGHGEEYPTCIEVDSEGNIYVAGIGGWRQYCGDYVVLKFAPDGSLIWSAFYDGGSYDTPYAMVLDGQDNCFVTGKSSGVGGYPNYDYATVKFNSQGQQEWIARHDATPRMDIARAITLDDAGNVYVTGACGYEVYYDYDYDYVTVKYDSLGIEQWVVLSDYNGEEDDPCDIAVDGAGCVYVTGFTGDGYNTDFLTYKYDDRGDTQWEIRYNGTENATDMPCGLVLDEYANVYVSGYCGWSSYSDFITFKYDSAGVLLWQDQYNSPNDWDDEAVDLALDADGNLIIAGSSQSYPLGNSYLTVKYTADGTRLWAREHPGIGNCLTYAHAMAVDAGGNIYITGSDGSPAWIEPFIESCHTIKYDPLGNLQWEATYSYPNSDDAETIGNDIAVDPWGNAVVASSLFFAGCNEDHDIVTIKYHENMGDVIVGMVPQVSPIEIPASGGRFSYHLMAINNVMDSLATDYWWQVIFPNTCSRSIGLEQSVLPMDSISFAMTQNVPALVPPGRYQYIVYVGDYPGIIWASDTLDVRKLADGAGQIVNNWDYTLLEMDPEESAKSGPFQPSTIIVHPCCPNPFNPVTSIGFDLPEAAKVQLTVYDIAGREVVRLINGWRDAGCHEVTFDASGLASGVYIYQLEARSGVGTTPTMEIGKMVLLK